MRVVLRAGKREFSRHPAPIISNIYASRNKRYWSPQMVLLRFFQMSGLGFSSNICTLQPSKTSQECNIVFTKLGGTSPLCCATFTFYCFNTRLFFLIRILFCRNIVCIKTHLVYLKTVCLEN